VALEMVASGAFDGPVVLLGISLSPQDEPPFFRAIVRLDSVLGGLPAALLARGAASMVKRIAVSAERQSELRDDFRKNVPLHNRDGLREYMRWLHRHERPAERLCEAGSRRGSFTPRRATAVRPPTSAAHSRHTRMRIW